MSFIGSMLSNSQGAGAQAAPTYIQSDVNKAQTDQAYNDAQSGLSQQQNFVNALQGQNGIGNQSSVFNQQQALANQLQGVANGTGPNPALAQLNQTTGNNISNQAALMAGQRGSGANAGLLARQAAQQGGALQQQAVGQGATLQAQQQLGGMQALAAQQQALGQTAGTQVGQQANALSGYNQMAQGEQQNLLNAVAQLNNANVGQQSNINNNNIQMAGINARGQQGLLGGAISGISQVPGLLGGGGAAAGGAGAATAGLGAGTATAGSAAEAAPLLLAAAHGGMVPQSHVGKYMAHGGKVNMTDGGHVPGEGNVAGDSYSNDTVPAVLSPKEIVIPRHITMGENAPQRAAEFVAKILGQKHDSKSNFYSGGEAEGGAGGSEEEDEEETPATGGGASGSFAVEGQGSPTQKNPEIATTPAQQMSPDMISQLQGSFEKQKQAAQMLGAAQGQQGKAESDILGQNTKDLQGLQQKYDPQYADIDQERSALTQDIQNGHIDPNHLINNMGTSQKIGTAIGLILGGIGSGLTGKENPAQQFLQSQINADIEGQKADIGKKENLLSMNMRRFGNLKDAEMMTRANMMDITSMKLKQAAAQSQDPIARANALNEAAKIDAQAAQTIGPLKLQQQMRQQAMQGGQDPSKLVPFLVPKEHQGKVFTEVQQAQDASNSENDIMKQFDKANEENSVGGRIGRAGFTPPSVKALNALFMPLIHDQVGRVNEAERQSLENLVPSPGDQQETVSAKKAALQDFINHKKSAPTAKAYGIDLGNFQSTTTNPVAKLGPQGQQWAQWAQQNPNNPMAIAFKKKMGI